MQREIVNNTTSGCRRKVIFQKTKVIQPTIGMSIPFVGCIYFLSCKDVSAERYRYYSGRRGRKIPYVTEVTYGLGAAARRWHAMKDSNLRPTA